MQWLAQLIIHVFGSYLYKSQQIEWMKWLNLDRFNSFVLLGLAVIGPILHLGILHLAYYNEYPFVIK